MKHNRSGGWVLIIALAVLPTVTLTPAALLAEDDAAESTGSAPSTAAAPAEAEEAGNAYVVHDEVFVDETALEIPGSSTIAAKLPLALDETPLAIDSVGSDTLEVRDAQVLGDALENVSGVNVQSGNGIFDAFTLRGLDSVSNGLILVDGAREPQSAFFQLYNVERVEVLKGPSSFLYGGASMGGAVNLVRKQPRPGNFTGFSASGGTYSTFQGTLDANFFDDSERWGVRFNGQWWQSDLHRDGKEAESFAVNPAFTFRASDRTSIHLSLEYADTDAVPDSGVPVYFNGRGFQVAAVDRERTVYDLPASRSEQQAYRFQVDVETRFSETFVLRNKTYYRRLDWLSDATSLDGVILAPDPNPLGFPDFVARTQQTLDDEQTFTGNQLEALWKIEAGRVSHNLLFGVEYARLEDEFTFVLDSLPLAFLSSGASSGFPPASPLFAFGTDAESTVVAPYLIDQIHFSEKFQLLLGLRYDDIDFEDAVFGTRRDDSKASPMIGAVFSPKQGFSIYVNAGQAFAPQSTFVVGETRDPEESEQVELGFRAARADGKLRASLAVYRIDRENVAIPDQTGVLRQTGAQRNEGVELEIAAEIRPGLNASFSYTWTDAELTEFTLQSFVFDPATGGFVPVVVDLGGNKAAWVPENIFNLWLSRKFDNGWGLGAGGRWVDEQFIAEDNAFAIDDYFMADAAVWFSKRPWRFQVNLDNLTDEDTFTRVFAGSSVIPAPGFTARAGVRYGIR